MGRGSQGHCWGCLSACTPPHAKEGGDAPSGSRLLLITGRRPVLRALAPVIGPPGQPVECRVVGRTFEHPTQIIAIVGRKPELGTVSHNDGQCVKGLARHDTTTLVAGPWPTVWAP